MYVEQDSRTTSKDMNIRSEIDLSTTSSILFEKLLSQKIHTISRLLFTMPRKNYQALLHSKELVTSLKSKSPSAATSLPINRLFPVHPSSLQIMVTQTNLRAHSYANKTQVVPAWTWTLEATSLKSSLNVTHWSFPGKKSMQGLEGRLQSKFQRQRFSRMSCQWTPDSH